MNKPKWAPAAGTECWFMIPTATGRTVELMGFDGKRWRTRLSGEPAEEAYARTLAEVGLGDALSAGDYPDAKSQNG